MCCKAVLAMSEATPKRNPDWKAAELLLALNAYFELNRSGDKPTDTHPTVVRTRRPPVIE